MKAANKKCQEFLTRLFADMKPGTSKKVDNSKTYMPLSVERLSEDRFSMAHYFEQNGDLVPDPDMEFWRDAFGNYFPVALQQCTGFYTKAIEFGANGEPSGVRPRAQRELNSFLDTWVKNLKHQQSLA